ncbi:MAG: hypothetical protein IKN79_02665 [Eubacterium sp.]|nr:hypothetical protein [Eubacterium sp.]
MGTVLPVSSGMWYDGDGSSRFVRYVIRYAWYDGDGSSRFVRYVIRYAIRYVIRYAIRYVIELKGKPPSEMGEEAKP